MKFTEQEMDIRANEAECTLIRTRHSH